MSSRLRPFGFLFEKSLNDLIRGIRARKDPDILQDYLRLVISECREEVKSPNMDVKAMAVLKLAYLEMLGFDMSWAGFHVLEVMASSSFQQKRIGYLAAMQSFRADPELLMLATNLLKTDLASSNSSLSRVAISLSGLASIVTPLLAADVSDDILRMMNHSQPYIRKKAVLAMHKVVLQYPEALQVCLPRLAEKIEDEDPSVVAAAVNVIGEFAQHSDDPAPFVALTPQLYSLLLSSTNNWTLIKLLKLFAHFTRYEPRLKTKLLPAIQELLDSKASSLMYECLACILHGRMLDADDHMLAGRCVAKIRQLLQENDPNLKYVSLQSLSEMADLNEGFVRDIETQQVLLSCLSDTSLLQDPAIRPRILAILGAIVNEDNLYDLVAPLLEYIREDRLFARPDSISGDTELARAIIDLCSLKNYGYLPQFVWYLDILLELSHRVPDSGTYIGEQLVNIAVRVKSVRCDVVTMCFAVIRSSPEISGLTDKALWVLGEYASYLDTSEVGGWPSVLREVLGIKAPSGSVVSCVAKIVVQFSQNIVDWDGSLPLIEQEIRRVVETLGVWSKNPDFELQERSCQYLEFFRLVLEGLANDSGKTLLTKVLPSFYSSFEMTPLAADSQSRIVPPPQLDLSTPIHHSDIVSDSESDPEWEPELVFEEEEETFSAKQQISEFDELKERSKIRNSPFYISDPTHFDTVDSPSLNSGDDSEKVDYSVEELKSRLGSGTSNSGETPSTKSVTSKPGKSTKPAKPAKVKVEVAGDEIVPDSRAESVRSQSVYSHKGQSTSKPLFQVGFRTANRHDLVEAESSASPAAEPAPVIVKHKKKKSSSDPNALKIKVKKSKSKSAHETRDS